MKKNLKKLIGGIFSLIFVTLGGKYLIPAFFAVLLETSMEPSVRSMLSKMPKDIQVFVGLKDESVNGNLTNIKKVSKPKQKIVYFEELQKAIVIKSGVVKTLNSKNGPISFSYKYEYDDFYDEHKHEFNISNPDIKLSNLNKKPAFYICSSGISYKIKVLQVGTPTRRELVLSPPKKSDKNCIQ